MNRNLREQGWVLAATIAFAVVAMQVDRHVEGLSAWRLAFSSVLWVLWLYLVCWLEGERPWKVPLPQVLAAITFGAFIALVGVAFEVIAPMS